MIIIKEKNLSQLKSVLKMFGFMKVVLMSFYLVCHGTNKLFQDVEKACKLML